MTAGGAVARSSGIAEVYGRFATTRSTPVIAPADLPTSRKFMIFAVMAFGQFLALIDIQIVAASLNNVQAGLSAGPDEISWVQTGYLMAELVMIPFSLKKCDPGLPATLPNHPGLWGELGAGLFERRAERPTAKG